MSNSLPIFNENFSLAQKQGICLLMYFAGQETSAFALTRNLAALALDPLKQKALYRSFQENPTLISSEIPDFKQFINDQLLKSPPTDGYSRKLKADSYISFDTTDGKSIGKFMRAGERILINCAGTAEKISKSKLNPNYNDASIFGSGANGCIGKFLALKELFQLPNMILTQCEMITEESEFKYTSKATKQAKTFLIKVKFKDF